MKKKQEPLILRLRDPAVHRLYNVDVLQTRNMCYSLELNGLPSVKNHCLHLDLPNTNLPKLYGLSISISVKCRKTNHVLI